MSASRNPQVTGIALGIALSIGPAVLTSLAADWYAAPNGQPPPAGTGQMNAPWDLQTALDPSRQQPPPNRVQAGDTVWLLDGEYTPTQQGCPDGNFCCKLAGTAALPIVVQQYPGHHARINGGVRLGNLGIIHVRYDYVHFRDFEIMSSALDHSSECADPNCVPCTSLPPDIQPALAFTVHQADPNDPVNIKGLKFINLIIHDTAEPWYLHQDAEGAEVYGCIIYYNGWQTVCANRNPNRGHGHGVYVQNDTAAPKKVIDNIVFSQFGSGIVGYSTTIGELNNIYVEGNIVFNNGLLTALFPEPYNYGYQDNILVGDSVEVVNPQVLNNYTYFTPAQFQGSLTGGRGQLGHAQTSRNAVATGNYFIAQDGSCLMFKGLDVNDPGGAVITNNVFFGSTCSDKMVTWDTLELFRGPQHNNSFYGAPTTCVPQNLGSPTGIQSFVRGNRYDPTRAHIVVYSWAADVNDVMVNVSSVMSPAEYYQVLDVQNYYGAPIATGFYGGGSISIPMADVNAPASQPWGTPGRQSPKHTPKQFGVFVLIHNYMQQEGPVGGGP